MIKFLCLVLSDCAVSVATYEGGDPEGMPLFLLHGNSLAANVFKRQFEEPALQQFRLVALDLPGHGRSPAAPGHYALPAMRAVVMAALRALRLEQALAVGHSYGGNLLLELLPDLPSLRGLMTVGAPPVSTPSEMQAAFQLNETGRLFYQATLSAAQVQALARYCLRPAATATEVALLAADIARTDGQARADLLASIGAGEMHDEVGFVGRTSVPLALAVGELDDAIRFPYFDTLQAPSRWGKPLHIVPGSGHSPFLENPRAFNQLLLQFAQATRPA